MSPKRGQPPKPPEKRRTIYKNLAYNPEEIEKLEKAWQLAGSPNTISRWLATVTLDEAEKIITEYQK